MRVKFNALALLLDASLEGEYDLVQRVIYDVSHLVLIYSRCRKSARTLQETLSLEHRNDGF